MTETARTDLEADDDTSKMLCGVNIYAIGRVVVFLHNDIERDQQKLWCWRKVMRALEELSKMIDNPEDRTPAGVQLN
jgi:hypothetical protein